MNINSTADRNCDGCDQPASDVGPLTACRVTFRRSHSSAPVVYCHACLEIIEASVLKPCIGGFGAVGLHTEITKIERTAEFDSRAFPRTMDTQEILDEFDAGNSRILEDTDFGNPYAAFVRHAS